MIERYWLPHDWELLVSKLDYTYWSSMSESHHVRNILDSPPVSSIDSIFNFFDRLKRRQWMLLILLVKDNQLTKEPDGNQALSLSPSEGG